MNLFSKFNADLNKLSDNELQAHKDKMEEDQSNRTKRTAVKRTATMIKKRRVNPHIAKNEAPIIAEKNDINRMIEKNDREE